MTTRLLWLKQEITDIEITLTPSIHILDTTNFEGRKRPKEKFERIYIVRDNGSGVIELKHNPYTDYSKESDWHPYESWETSPDKDSDVIDTIEVGYDASFLRIVWYSRKNGHTIKDNKDTEICIPISRILDIRTNTID